MSEIEARRQAQEDSIVREVLRNGPHLDRRKFFVSAGAFAAAVGTPAGQALAQAAPPAPPAGAPAPAAPAPAAPPRVILRKPDDRLLNIGATVRSGRYWEFTTWVTPVEEFYIRNHYPTPVAADKAELKAENWKMRVHGASVRNPMEITYNDLTKMPARTIIANMQCHGNGRNLFWEMQGYSGQQVTGGSWVLGAIGNAEWRFVPISYIFDRVGLADDALTALFWSGVDGNDMGRPIPVAELRARGDDIGICYQMNGNALTADHGAPVRLVVPGWGGTASIKWLTEIRVTPKRVWCRLNTKGEVYIGDAYPRPQFSADDEFVGVAQEDIRGPMVTWMPPQSTLTVPLVLDKTPNVPANYPLKRGELPTLSAGLQTLRGYAWGPQFGVRDVDYRIDGGPWQPARILPPNLGRYTWVRFEFPWNATTGEHTIETRTTDSSGYSQPASQPPNLFGMANGTIPGFRIRVV
jgi:DMSO/TMAO reductase YedYZ molybdopterin-dependent catalytic subunit